MNDRDKNILDAAMRTFSRYGVKRTSMNDLAQEAGISRQTLYNAYPNKDEVLRALIRVYSEKSLAEAIVATEQTSDLGVQLDIVFSKMVVEPYDILSKSENAQDILDGMNETSIEELEFAAEQFRALIERLLLPHMDALKNLQLSVRSVSDFVQKSAKAAKNAARDRDHLLQQLDVLKRMTLRCVDAR